MSCQVKRAARSGGGILAREGRLVKGGFFGFSALPYIKAKKRVIMKLWKRLILIAGVFAGTLAAFWTVIEVMNFFEHPLAQTIKTWNHGAGLWILLALSALLALLSPQILSENIVSTKILKPLASAIKWLIRHWRYILLAALLVFLEFTLYWLEAGLKLVALSVVHFTLVTLAILLLWAPQAYISWKEFQNLYGEMQWRNLERLPLRQIANVSDLSQRYPSLPLGEREFNGVPFLLNTRYLNTHYIPAHVDTPAEVRPDRPLEGVSSVHMLTIAGDGYRRHEGVTIGRIQLIFDDGSSHEKELILGQNIREWAPDNRPGELVDSVTERLSRDAWEEHVPEGRRLIDHLEIPVPEDYRRKALERILIFRDIRPGTPEGALSFSIFAITLEWSVTVLTRRQTYAC